MSVVNQQPQVAVGGSDEAQRGRINISGVLFDRVVEAEVIAIVQRAVADGRGGRIITPNVDILRACRSDVDLLAHVRDASLVVADGAPLIWASRLAGRPLPARVAGSDLIWSLSGGLAEDKRSIYLLGGAEGVPDGAGRNLVDRYPGLVVAGCASPPFGFDTNPEQLAHVIGAVVAAKPDLVFVGLGFPKQERVIEALREAWPTAWYLGCGAAIAFVAGQVPRAPRWMQRTGLEWIHRLLKEPRRLAGRYLWHDLPFAVRLLLVSALRRRHVGSGLE